MYHTKKSTLLAWMLLCALSGLIASTYGSPISTGVGSFRIKLHQKTLSNQLKGCYDPDLDLSTSYQNNYLYKLLNIERPKISEERVQIPAKSRTSCRNALKSSAFMPYTGRIRIGKPPQLFEALFDTGSDVLWVQDSKCELNGVCKESEGRVKFDSDKSTTCKRIKREPVSLMYGNQMEFSGWWVRDIVQLTDEFKGSRALAVPNQALAMICSINGPVLHDTPFDALVGLSFPGPKSANASTLLENLIRYKLLDEPIFSFYTSKPGTEAAREKTGELIFGQIDSAHFTGAITWAPVTRAPLWEIRVRSIRLLGGGEPRVGPESPEAMACAYGCQAVIDTGTSMIIGPDAEVALLNERLGFMRHNRERNVFLAPGPCARYYNNSGGGGGGESLVFEIEKNFLELKPDAYLIEVDASLGTKVCVSALRSHEDEPTGWILGSPFISSFYAIFDFGRKRVGFAQAIL